MKIIVTYVNTDTSRGPYKDPAAPPLLTWTVTDVSGIELRALLQQEIILDHAGNRRFVPFSWGDVVKWEVYP